MWGVLLTAATWAAGDPAVAVTPAAVERKVDPGSGSGGAAVEAPDSTVAERVRTLISLLEVPASRSDARDELIALGRAATPYMMARTRDASFTVRWEMVNIQGTVLDESAIPALVERALHDVDPHVRWRSLWAIQLFEIKAQAPAVELLGKALRTGSDEERWNAAVGLSMLDARECLEAIHAGLNQTDDWRRWEAINALRRVHDNSSAGRLGPLTRTGSVRDRREAVLSLAEIAGEEAVKLLTVALADLDAGVRWRAVMGLSQLGDPRAVPAINELRKTETDADVLKHITEALAQLSPVAAPQP